MNSKNESCFIGRQLVDQFIIRVAFDIHSTSCCKRKRNAFSLRPQQTNSEGTSFAQIPMRSAKVVGYIFN